MKFVVPMFATVDAADAEDAYQKVSDATTLDRTGGLPIYIDETLDAFAYNPEVHEPHSVLDKAEIEIEP